jgi:hypothetical protein
MLFHTHWQSMFSNGTGAGLEALGALAERINTVWGRKIKWMPAREVTVYCTAREATKIDVGEGGSITLTAPFTCPEFTFAVPLPPEVTRLEMDGGALGEVPVGELEDGTWARDEDRAVVCVPVRGETRLRFQ